MAPRLLRTGWHVLTAALLLTGCATVDSQPPPILTGDPVRDARTWLERSPARDRVLWQYRLAAAQLRAGDREGAARTLDEALAVVGGVLTADAGTRRARSLFGAEEEKNYIGEPYERVMAWMYRGLLYWDSGEPDNARAAFRTGQVIDTDPENQRVGSDFVLLDLLDAQATAQLGGDFSSALSRARQLAPQRSLDVTPRATVLFFAELGVAPQKFADGQYGEKLRFRAGPSRLRSARLTIGSGVIPLMPLDDLAFQATTRGGRVMDYILGNKVVFREFTEGVGQAAILAGAAVLSGKNRSEGRQNVGYALIAAGVAAQILAQATQTRADTRTWDNLPQYLAYVPLELAPGEHAAVLEFLDDAGRVVPEMTQNFTLTAGESGRPSIVLRSSLH